MRTRLISKRGVLGGFALAVTGTLATAAACLPDLAPIPPLPEASVPAPVACGDGLIDRLEDGGLETCDPGASGDGGDAPGCEGCQITCGGALDPTSSHCYFTAGEGSTFAGAEEACARAGAHVVTIASAEEAKLVDGLAGGDYWVGLERVESRGGYATPAELGEPGVPSAGAPACSGCFAIGADGGDFEPIAADAGSGACLVASSGAWRTAPCGESFGILCEREPRGRRAQSCGGLLCTTVTVTAQTKRYVIVLSPASAGEAKTFCESYEGGGLVRLESRAEREQLAREIAAVIGDVAELWIGLAGLEDGGAYAWDDGVLDGEQGRPRVWGSGQPGAGARRAFLRFGPSFDSRLAFVADAGQSETPDAERRAFVCQRPLEGAAP